MKKRIVVLKKNKKNDPSLIIIIKKIEDNKIRRIDYFTKEKLHCWRN